MPFFFLIPTLFVNYVMNVVQLLCSQYDTQLTTISPMNDR